MILHGFSASGFSSSIVIRVTLSGVVVEAEKVNLNLISYLKRVFLWGWFLYRRSGTPTEQFLEKETFVQLMKILLPLSS